MIRFKYRKKIKLETLIYSNLGDADIVLADAGSGQILNTVHVNQKVRKLLAVGKRQVFEECIGAQ